MKILFVIQASHWHVGGHALVRRYSALAHAVDYSTSVMVVPYRDRLWESSYHWFTNAKMAKKTYDYCFVIESAPPEEWVEAFQTIYWVPMVEFTKKSHIEKLHPSIKILWHAKSGFDASSPILGDKNQQIYVPYGIERNSTTDVSTRVKDPSTIIVHQRARCFDVNVFMETLLTKSDRAKIVLWNQVGRRDALDHWQGPRVRLTNGWISDEMWKSMTSMASIYVAGRAMEGIGLCVQEAASNGCIIAGPKQSVSAEYINNPEGSILVDLHERPQGDWLTKRYDWSSCDGGKESATIELAEMVAEKIDYDTQDRIISCGRMAEQQIHAATAEFERHVNNLLKEMKPREVIHIPKTRRRILSIQTTTWGGQGLFELWMIRHIARHPHHSVFSSRLWIQKNDAEEQTEYARLMSGQDIRMVAPHYDDLVSVDPDFVVYHWSAGGERLCNQSQMNGVQRYLFDTKASVIVFVHNIQPENLPDWLKKVADVFVFPSEHAANAYRESLKDTPIVVLPHFLDPELTAIPPRPVREKIIIGAMGRIQWTKCDPIYYQSISTFLNEVSGREFMWIGGSSDGYLEGDGFTKNTIHPDIHAAFGPDRASLLDKITVGLFLSPVEESFCLAALEMASRGIPIITNRPEIKNLLGEASVVASSPESVLEVLRNLLRDGTAYGKMMRAGLALRQDSRYSFERWEQGFFNLLANYSPTHGFRDWTVIIPCHNVEGYLEECVESVMTNDPKQTILVLDGCTDRTHEVANKLKQKYSNKNEIQILVNRNPPHSQGQAWKCAFPHAKHNLIALVDGDDKLANGALKVMGKAHLENPKAGLIWSNQCVIDHHGTKLDISFSNRPMEGETILEAMERGENVVSHLITMKAWVLPFLDFPDDLDTSADKHLALLLEERAPWVFVDEELYVYRWKRPGSITDQHNEDQEASRERVLEIARSRRS